MCCVVSCKDKTWWAKNAGSVYGDVERCIVYQVQRHDNKSLDIHNALLSSLGTTVFRGPWNFEQSRKICRIADPQNLGFFHGNCQNSENALKTNAFWQCSFSILPKN